MSIYPLARVWDHSRQRGTALLILLAMADRADELGVVWAGTNWLAGRARVERRQIIRTVQSLEAAGELRVIRARRPTGQTIVNHYIITTGASDDTLAEAQRRVGELLAMRGGVIEDTPEGVTHDTREGVAHDTRGVSPMTRGSVTPGHGGGDTVSHDPYSYPEEEEGDLPSLPAETLWRAALGELEMQMPKATFRQWLQGTTADWSGRDLVVHCRNAAAVELLRERLQQLVQRAVEAAAGSPYPVQFEVAT